VDEDRVWAPSATVGTRRTALFTGLVRPVTLSVVKTTAFPFDVLELC